jgi:hypothetical protein
MRVPNGSIPMTKSSKVSIDAEGPAPPSAEPAHRRRWCLNQLPAPLHRLDRFDAAEIGAN